MKKGGGIFGDDNLPSGDQKFILNRQLASVLKSSFRTLTIENSKTVSQKCGRGCLREVVLYERFQHKALTENIFGVLGRQSLMGGSRMGGSTVY